MSEITKIAFRARAFVAILNRWLSSAERKALDVQVSNNRAELTEKIRYISLFLIHNTIARFFAAKSEIGVLILEGYSRDWGGYEWR